MPRESVHVLKVTGRKFRYKENHCNLIRHLYAAFTDRLGNRFFPHGSTIAHAGTGNQKNLKNLDVRWGEGALADRRRGPGRSGAARAAPLFRRPLFFGWRATDLDRAVTQTVFTDGVKSRYCRDCLPAITIYPFLKQKEQQGRD